MTVGGMLVAVGPGIGNLQDYTQVIPYDSIKIDAGAGATLDQFTSILWDPQSQSTIAPEDDIICVDASDPNGFPTVNLMSNPSFEGSYSGGIANGWSTFTPSGTTGMTFASSATAKYGSLSQSIAFANVPSGNLVDLTQTVTLPTNQFGALINQFPYTLSFWLNVPVAFTNVTCTLSLQWFTSGGAFISQSTLSLTTFVSSTQGWTRQSLSGTAPSNAATGHCFIQIKSTSATNTGTLLFDGAQFEYQTFYASYVNQISQSIVQTASQAGLYPTPFTDPAVSSVHFERQYKLYYRSVRLFGGVIRSIDNDYTIGPERLRTLNAVDYGVYLQEAPYNGQITALTDYGAIQQAVSYVQNLNSALLGGIDTTTFVQTLGTIQNFQINQQTFRDVIDHVANDTGATYWVDYDKYLHYASILAISAPFAFSSSPDLVKTFPFDNFTYTQDSTQSFSAKVIEGGTQISAPTAASFTGTSTTTTAALNNGTNYTSISINALPRTLQAGWTLQLGTGQTVTLSAVANNGATTLSVISFQANQTYGIGTTITLNGLFVNAGNPLYGVTSVTVAAVGQTVGLANATGGGSYQVLANLQTAFISFTTGPTNGTSIIISYTYSFPVLVRVRNAAAEGALGALRRPIHTYQKYDHINSVTDGIAVGQAELTYNGKQKPLGTIYCKSPTCPSATPLRPGQAVQLTHASAGFSNSLFQIQSVEVTSLGAGGIKYQIGIGYYRPDYIMTLVRQRASAVRMLANSTAGSVLNDVMTAYDAWTLGDGISNNVSNQAVYGTAQYGAANVYG